MKFRSRKGTVVADAYRKYGNVRGAFPIFDERSAKAALMLRGHAKTDEERRGVVLRASKYLPKSAEKAKQMDKTRKRHEGGDHDYED